MKPAYFTTASFDFLRELARHNHRDWFSAHQQDYEQTLRMPFQRLIADLAEPLCTISQHLVADPRKVGGSLFRQHRDTRFSKDKSIYKTWIGARFFHQRGKQVEAPSFYLHIAPGDCFFGGGLWHPQPDTLKKLRNFLDENPNTWRQATMQAGFRERYAFWGESLSRAPRGVDPAHPLIEDLKRKSLACGVPLSASEVLGHRLPEIVLGHMRAIAPMLDYLCAALDLDL